MPTAKIKNDVSPGSDYKLIPCLFFYQRALCNSKQQALYQL